MPPEDEKRIREFVKQLRQPITIYFRHNPQHTDQALSRFCDAASQFAPHFQVIKQLADPDEAPGLQIKPNITYHAVPQGPEVAPFLTALDYAANDLPSSAPPAIVEKLQQLTVPAELLIFISPHCPFCPAMVRRGIEVAYASELIYLSIIDAFLFPDMAEKYRVLSTPTTVLDNSFRWTGEVQTEEILEAITNRDPRRLGLGTFERIIEEGNASHIAAMILEQQEIFPVFIDLLSHTSLPVRLGAMVAAEELLEESPTLSSDMTLPLLDRLHTLEEPVMGDVIYLLGEIGDQRALSELNQIAAGHFSQEIKEAAQEAVAKF
jgi:hypothetical protein